MILRTRAPDLPDANSPFAILTRSRQFSERVTRPKLTYRSTEAKAARASTSTRNSRSIRVRWRSRNLLCLAADCNTEPMRQHSYAAFVVLVLADVLLAVYA